MKRPNEASPMIGQIRADIRKEVLEIISQHFTSEVTLRAEETSPHGFVIVATAIIPGDDPEKYAIEWSVPRGYTYQMIYMNTNEGPTLRNSDLARWMKSEAILIARKLGEMTYLKERNDGS